MGKAVCGRSPQRLFSNMARQFHTYCLIIQLCFSASAAFAQQDASPSLDRGLFGPFIRSLNVKTYGYGLVQAPTEVAPAKIVERFEVRDGDCHFNGEYSDCRSDRERSELWEQGLRSPEGTEAWYGWWFYTPEDWPDNWPTKTTLGQFHQWRSHPVWMFVHNGGLVLDDQSTGKTQRSIELIPHDEFAGRWHRIEVQAKWERNETGLFRVWVNGEQKFSWDGPTMTAETVYFRFGVYRAFVSRYLETTGDNTVPTQIAYFSEVRMARTREELEPRGE